jgi:hypothetical protein
MQRPTFQTTAPEEDVASFVKSICVDDPGHSGDVQLMISVAFPSVGIQRVSVNLFQALVWHSALVVYYDVGAPHWKGIPEPFI